MRKIPEKYIEDIRASSVKQIENEIEALREDITLNEEAIKADKAYLDFLFRELHDRKVIEKCTTNRCKQCRYFISNWQTCSYHPEYYGIDEDKFACSEFQLVK